MPERSERSAPIRETCPEHFIQALSWEFRVMFAVLPKVLPRVVKDNGDTLPPLWVCANAKFSWITNFSQFVTRDNTFLVKFMITLLWRDVTQGNTCSGRIIQCDILERYRA